jgi:Kelch motif
MLAITEKYYITDDEWDVLPPLLNTPKSGIALTHFQNRYLYAFGGDSGRTSGQNILSDIERLDLYYEEDTTRWEQLYIKHKQSVSPFAYGAAFRCGESSILIVGGK